MVYSLHNDLAVRTRRAVKGRSMLTNPKVALVIPTLHEAGNVRSLLDAARSTLAGVAARWEIIVVDDDSRDGTEELVLAAAQNDARVRLLVRRGERGLAGAILHGWQETDAEILGVMDADMQHPPELLPRLLDEILDGKDLAVASRYAEGGSLGGWNLLRALVSSAAVWVTVPLQRSGLRVRDAMSGYFMVRRHSVDGIAFRTTGFKLLLEILVRGRIASVSETPFTFGKRKAGASKANVGVAWEYLQLLSALYVFRVGAVWFRRKATAS